MLTCAWDDGLYYCNGGKIAKKSDGDAMDYEVDEAMCEATCNCNCNCGCQGECGGTCGCDNCNCATPERDELMKKLENPPARFNESFVRQLENDLTSALQELETLKGVPACQPCAEQQPEEDQPQTIAIEEPACLVDLSQTVWNWSGVSNVPTSKMRSHLTNNHSIEPASLDKMSREELIALHNLLHNEEVRASAPQAKSKTKSSSGGCPGGNCPTSGSSRSYSRGFGGFFRR